MSDSNKSTHFQDWVSSNFRRYWVQLPIIVENYNHEYNECEDLLLELIFNIVYWGIDMESFERLIMNWLINK